MKPRRLTHTIRQMERICPRCWAVSTQTEDGHRFTAFGVTRQQAIYRVYQKAKAYGRYTYPTAAGHDRKDAVKMPHDQVRRVRDGGGEPTTATIERPSTAVEIVQASGGDSEPGPEDTVITLWLADAGEWLGLDVLDHLIVGKGLDRVRPHSLALVEERRRGPPHRDVRPGWLARLSPALCGVCHAEPSGDNRRHVER